MRAIAQLVCVSFLVLFSTGAYAQSAAEKEAVDVIEKYWQARNDQDFKTQAALNSEKGTLDANSDGSFFRTSAKATAEELEEQLAGSQATKVFYPEATELGKDVVMVRYGAANRDERQFENPDKVDVERKKAGMHRPCTSRSRAGDSEPVSTA